MVSYFVIMYVIVRYTTIVYTIKLVFLLFLLQRVVELQDDDVFTVPMYFYDNALLKAKPDIEIYVYRFEAEVKVSSLIGDLLHRSLLTLMSR